MGCLKPSQNDVNIYGKDIGMIAETLKNEDMGWETEENRHGMIRDGAQDCYGRTHNYKLFTNGQSKKKKKEKT